MGAARGNEMMAMGNRFCIYTALVGNYDEVKQPQVVADDFDYYLFSDDIEPQRIGVWEVRPFGYRNAMATKTSRWPKMHPEVLLKEYEASVYIDANIVITSAGFYERVRELFAKNVLFASLIHPDWTCVYQEMVHIIYLGWEEESMVLKWGHVLRSEGFPKNMGTFENRILFRRHNDPRVKAVDERWWSCEDRYSRRDQLSLRYCLWKENVECHGFLPEGAGVDDNSLFSIYSHNSHTLKQATKNGDRSWLMRYYMKHADERQRIENAYYWIYARKYYMFWLNVVGQCFRFRHLLSHLFGRKEVYPWEIEGK